MNQDDDCGLVRVQCGPVLPGVVNSHSEQRGGRWDNSN